MRSDLSKLPTESVEFCVICKKNDTVRDISFEKYLCLTPVYQVRCCPVCGLRWLSPRPTRIGYESVYSADEYFKNEHVAYENLLSIRTDHFRQRLMSLSKYFSGRKSLKILDYGAATGDFVATAISLGNDCIGIEFSSDARKLAAEKNKIRLYSPEEFSSKEILFDVIHMNHVFEHIPDPANHLAWCRDRMEKNGLLIIEVPQQFNNHIDRLKRMLGRGGKLNEFTAFSLHHTYFFKTKNLVRLLEKSGFNVVHITTDVVGARRSGKMSPRILLMRLVSWISNLLNRGGDNIEVYARMAK